LRELTGLSPGLGGPFSEHASVGTLSLHIREISSIWAQKQALTSLDSTLRAEKRFLEQLLPDLRRAFPVTRQNRAL